MTEGPAKRRTDATHLGNSYSPDLDGKRDISIFSVDMHWRRASGQLPSFHITEPTPESRAIEDTTELYTTPFGGRFLILTFPEQCPSAFAETARVFAQAYYHEGLCTTSRQKRGKRIDCFRASELLFLHATSRGDVRAHTGLGMIYAHDRAEGHYFEALKNNLFVDAVLPKDLVRRKAYEHLKFATSADDPEAGVQFGDVLMEGIGCQPDARGAYENYQTAYRIAKEARYPAKDYLGAAALRLGKCHEYGLGCDRDYATALSYYETAVTCLEEAVKSGRWHLNIELSHARKGAMRMRQELYLLRL